MAHCTENTLEGAVDVFNSSDLGTEEHYMALQRIEELILEEVNKQETIEGIKKILKETPDSDAEVSTEAAMKIIRRMAQIHLKEKSI